MWFSRDLSVTCTWHRMQHPQLSPETPEITVLKRHTGSGCKTGLLNPSTVSARITTPSCHHANLPRADASSRAPPLIIILIQHYLILSYYCGKCYMISLLPRGSLLVKLWQPEEKVEQVNHTGAVGISDGTISAARAGAVTAASSPGGTAGDSLGTHSL